MEELAPDTIVHADGAGYVVHVRADAVTQIGDLVDERNLRGEKSVGGVFDQLRRLDRGDDEGRLDQVERTIEVAHDGGRLFVVAADHDAVGAHEVVNRRAFAQEFGIGDDGE